MLTRWLTRFVVALAVLTGTRADAQSISANQLHTCASTTSGQLYCWGTLGWWGVATAAPMPPDSVVLAPVLIGPRDARFQSVAAGWLHDCALTTDGRVICNGHNGGGELGRGGIYDIPPARVLTTLRFVSITAGQAHTCALTAEGRAYCWGRNDDGQIGLGTRVEIVDRPTAVIGGPRFRMLSAGSRHTCGITLTGATLCWGANTNGQLGRDPAIEDCAPNTACMAVPTTLDERRRFRTIAAGAEHTCGVTVHDQLFCWGENFSGYWQTKRPIATIRLTHVRAPGVIRSMSASWHSTCGVTDDGRAYCWGFGGVGRPLVRAGCRDADLCVDAVPVSATIRFSAVAVAEHHACGIGRSGAVYCWGRRDVRRVGAEHPAFARPPSCSPVRASTDVRCAFEPFRVLMPNLYTGERPAGLRAASIRP